MDGLDAFARITHQVADAIVSVVVVRVDVLFRLHKDALVHRGFGDVHSGIAGDAVGFQVPEVVEAVALTAAVSAFLVLVVEGIVAYAVLVEALQIKDVAVAVVGVGAAVGVGGAGLGILPEQGSA